METSNLNKETGRESSLKLFSILCRVPMAHLILEVELGFKELNAIVSFTMNYLV